jgi:GTP cyclohydrolase II
MIRQREEERVQAHGHGRKPGKLSALVLFGGIVLGADPGEEDLELVTHKRAMLAADVSSTDSGSTSGDEDWGVYPGKCHLARPDGGEHQGDAKPSAPSAEEAGALSLGHTQYVDSCQLPTSRGVFELRAYRHSATVNGVPKFHEPVVMVKGDLVDQDDVYVRIHDQCQTSEVLGSCRCDCREQLNYSLEYVQRHGGAVIYLQQEGRGIGLANKVAAYALQDGGMDTVDANRALGFGDDERSYECVPFILSDMRIRSIRLMTNNPFKVEWLKALGVNVVCSVPVIVPPNEHNISYLQSKAQRMSHLIDGL